MSTDRVSEYFGRRVHALTDAPEHFTRVEARVRPVHSDPEAGTVLVTLAAPALARDVRARLGVEDPEAPVHVLEGYVDTTPGPAETATGFTAFEVVVGEHRIGLDRHDGSEDPFRVLLRFLEGGPLVHVDYRGPGFAATVPA